MGSRVHIVATVVAPVGIIGFFVVFKAVDPAVVVHVNAKEVFGPIGVIAQEGLFVIGNEVLAILRIVLVEIRNEIVVLVKTRKDRIVRQHTIAVPVRPAVLVIVVLDELVDIGYFVFVIDFVLSPSTR